MAWCCGGGGDPYDKYDEDEPLLPQYNTQTSNWDSSAPSYQSQASLAGAGVGTSARGGRYNSRRGGGGRIRRRRLTRVSLAYNGSVTIAPYPHAATVDAVDVSYNRLRSLASLAQFRGATEIIADGNMLTDQAGLPDFHALRLLYVNKNQIVNLTRFIDEVAAAAPNLEYLSMQDNPACPNFFHGGSPRAYADYRLYVISRFDRMRYLDYTEVSRRERRRAERTFGALTKSARRRVATKHGHRRKKKNDEYTYEYEYYSDPYTYEYESYSSPTPICSYTYSYSARAWSWDGDSGEGDAGASGQPPPPVPPRPKTKPKPKRGGPGPKRGPGKKPSRWSVGGNGNNGDDDDEWSGNDDAEPGSERPRPAAIKKKFGGSWMPSVNVVEVKRQDDDFLKLRGKVRSWKPPGEKKKKKKKKKKKDKDGADDDGEGKKKKKKKKKKKGKDHADGGDGGDGGIGGGNEAGPSVPPVAPPPPAKGPGGGPPPPPPPPPKSGPKKTWGKAGSKVKAPPPKAPAPKRRTWGKAGSKAKNQPKPKPKAAAKPKPILKEADADDASEEKPHVRFADDVAGGPPPPPDGFGVDAGYAPPAAPAAPKAPARPASAAAATPAADDPFDIFADPTTRKSASGKKRGAGVVDIFNIEAAASGGGLMDDDIDDLFS